MDSQTWNEFCSEITIIYNKLIDNEMGNVASLQNLQRLILTYLVFLYFQLM